MDRAAAVGVATGQLGLAEATRWWLGFGDDLQDQRGAEKSLQIDDAVDCAGSLDPSCVKCEILVSVAEHLHILSPYSFKLQT